MWLAVLSDVSEDVRSALTVYNQGTFVDRFNRTLFYGNFTEAIAGTLDLSGTFLPDFDGRLPSDNYWTGGPLVTNNCFSWNDDTNTFNGFQGSPLDGSQWWSSGSSPCDTTNHLLCVLVSEGSPAGIIPSFGLGEQCDASFQCDSGFCVDGYCCDNACDLPYEACNITSLEGTCSPETTDITTILTVSVQSNSGDLMNSMALDVADGLCNDPLYTMAPFFRIAVVGGQTMLLRADLTQFISEPQYQNVTITNMFGDILFIGNFTNMLESPLDMATQFIPNMAGQLPSSFAWTGGDMINDCNMWTNGTDAYNGSLGSPVLNTTSWWNINQVATCDTSLVVFCTGVPSDIFPHPSTIPRFELNTTCDANFQCDSGFCVDGVCCNRACQDTFEACNIPSFEGTCSPVTTELTTILSVSVLSSTGDLMNSVPLDVADGLCNDPMWTTSPYFRISVIGGVMMLVRQDLVESADLPQYQNVTITNVFGDIVFIGNITDLVQDSLIMQTPFLPDLSGSLPSGYGWTGGDGVNDCDSWTNGTDAFTGSLGSPVLNISNWWNSGEMALCDQPQLVFCTAIPSDQFPHPGTIPRFPLNATCAADFQCDSGFCSDGVCCDNACDSLCESCVLAGSEGLCTFISLGQDPDNECTNEDVCGGDGTCFDIVDVGMQSFSTNLFNDTLYSVLVNGGFSWSPGIWLATQWRGWGYMEQSTCNATITQQENLPCLQTICGYANPYLTATNYTCANETVPSECTPLVEPSPCVLPNITVDCVGCGSGGPRIIYDTTPCYDTSDGYPVTGDRCDPKAFVAVEVFNLDRDFYCMGAPGDIPLVYLSLTATAPDGVTTSTETFIFETTQNISSIFNCTGGMRRRSEDPLLGYEKKAVEIVPVESFNEYYFNAARQDMGLATEGVVNYMRRKYPERYDGRYPMWEETLNKKYIFSVHKDLFWSLSDGCDIETVAKFLSEVFSLSRDEAEFLITYMQLVCPEYEEKLDRLLEKNPGILKEDESLRLPDQLMRMVESEEDEDATLIQVIYNTFFGSDTRRKREYTNPEEYIRFLNELKMRYPHLARVIDQEILKVMRSQQGSRQTRSLLSFKRSSPDPSDVALFQDYLLMFNSTLVSGLNETVILAIIALPQEQWNNATAAALPPSAPQSLIDDIVTQLNAFFVPPTLPPTTAPPTTHPPTSSPAAATSEGLSGGAIAAIAAGSVAALLAVFLLFGFAGSMFAGQDVEARYAYSKVGTEEDESEDEEVVYYLRGDHDKPKLPAGRTVKKRV